MHGDQSQWVGQTRTGSLSLRSTGVMTSVGMTRRSCSTGSAPEGDSSGFFPLRVYRPASVVPRGWDRGTVGTPAYHTRGRQAMRTGMQDVRELWHGGLLDRGLVRTRVWGTRGRRA